MSKPVQAAAGKIRQIPKLLRPWLEAALRSWRLILVIIAALMFATSVVYGLAKGWTATQWGPYSGWFSAVATVMAISLSLWQARDSMRRADALEEARDTERRIAQIDLIVPIWAKVAEIRSWHDFYLTRLERAHKGITGTDRAEMANAESELMTMKDEWTVMSMQLDLLFEPALLKVTQSNVQDYLSDVYRDFFLLGNEIQTAIHNVGQHTPPDPMLTKTLVKLLGDRRRIMFQLMRHHLTKAPKVEFKRYPWQD